MCDILLTKENLDKVYNNQYSDNDSDDSHFVWGIQHWDGDSDIAYIRNDNVIPNVEWLIRKVMCTFWNDDQNWYENYNSFAGKPSPTNHIFRWERKNNNEIIFMMDLAVEHFRIVFRNEKDSQKFFKKYNEKYEERFYELYPEKK